MKKRILACLCALVCFNNTKPSALPSCVVDNIGILGEFFGLSMLEFYFISDANNKGSFGKYHFLAVVNPIFLVWDLYERITNRSSDIRKSVEDSGKNKANIKKV